MSGEVDGTAVELHAVTEGSAASRSAVAHERELVALAEAVVQGDDAALAAARERGVAALGPDAYVEAAAVASNFERMVRIADATGIALDSPLDAVSAGMRAELGIDAFGSAANTPVPSAFRLAVGRLLAPFAGHFMSFMARRSRRSTPAGEHRSS